MDWRKLCSGENWDYDECLSTAEEACREGDSEACEFMVYLEECYDDICYNGEEIFADDEEWPT